MTDPFLRLVVNWPAAPVLPVSDAALAVLLKRAKTLEARAADMVEQCGNLPLGDPIWLRAKTLAAQVLPVLEQIGQQAAALRAETREGLQAKAALALLLADESEATAGVLSMSLAADVVAIG